MAWGGYHSNVNPDDVYRGDPVREISLDRPAEVALWDKLQSIFDNGSITIPLSDGYWTGISYGNRIINSNSLIRITNNLSVSISFDHQGTTLTLVDNSNIAVGPTTESIQPLLEFAIEA